MKKVTISLDEVHVEALEIEQLLLCQYEMLEDIGIEAERYMKNKTTDITEANLIIHEIKRLYQRLMTINNICREKAISIQHAEPQ